MSNTTTKVRVYETICLTKVDMPQDKYTAMLDRCKKAVAEQGKGEWLYEDDWGKAKISYVVNKEPRAQWTYFRFKSEPAGVDELVRGLGINEFVLRQVTSRTSEDGADYNTLRPTFAKDLNERDKPREWKDPRGRRGPRGDRGDRGDRSAPASEEKSEASSEASSGGKQS